MKADYTREDVCKAMEAVGIGRGDDVFLHSNLGFFGLPENCRSSEEMCELFRTSIQSVIGDDGTFVVPTFSYSYCHGEIYDPLQTKTNCGMLSEYMRKKFPQNRSLDPNFSICGTGAHMGEYLRCNIHETFGKGSFWEKFMQYDGKIVCMNFDAGSTFVHYIERQNNVPYRYNKAFNGISMIDGASHRDYAVHFVCDGGDDAASMERVDELCTEHGISKQVELGKGTVLSFSAQTYFDFFSKLLKTRPRILCVKEELSE